MPKSIRVNPDYDFDNDRLTGVNWRLPDDVNLSALAEKVLAALDAGDSILVEVEVGDAPRTRAFVVINSQQVTSAVLSETQEPSP